MDGTARKTNRGRYEWSLVLLLSLVVLLAACGGGEETAGPSQPPAEPAESAPAESVSAEPAPAESVSAEPAGEPLVIGMPLARSGWMEPYDSPALVGAEIAVDEINAAGGVLGRPLKLVVTDTKSDPAQSTVAGQEAIDAGAEFVVPSCNYEIGSPAAKVAIDAGLVAMSVCAGSPLFGTQGVGPLAYTNGTVVPTVGAVMATFAYENQGWKRPYILTDVSTGYTTDMCGYFKSTWVELAGEDSIAGEDTFQNDDPTIGAQISRINSLSEAPDFLAICTLGTGGASAFRQIRAAGIDVPILTGDGMDGDYWLDAVPNFKDFYETVAGSTFGDDPDPAVNEFVQKFAERTGDTPHEGSYALFGYDTMFAFKRAAEEAGSTDGEALNAAFEQFQDVPLLVGPTTFTPEYHFARGRSMKVLTLVDNKPTYVATVTPAIIPEIKF